MTMHMVHAGLNDINLKSKTKKLTPAQIKAKAEHEKYLKSQGLHPDQLAARAKKPSLLKKRYAADDGTAPCSNGFAHAGAKKSIFDSQWQRTYEDDPAMAEREAEALRAAESLKQDLIPLYNKGPIQLKSKQLKMTDLGKRRP
jgi:hypothetical protein